MAQLCVILWLTARTLIRVIEKICSSVIMRVRLNHCLGGTYMIIAASMKLGWCNKITDIDGMSASFTQCDGLK